MAVSYVKNGPDTYTSATSGTTTATTSAGDWIVVVMNQTNNVGPRTWTCSDDGGLTWNADIGGSTLEKQMGSFPHKIKMWYAYDAAGGTRVITITPTEGATSFILHNFEVTGLGSGSVGDLARFYDEGTNVTDHATTATATTDTAGGFAVSLSFDTAAGQYGACTPGSGWTEEGELDGQYAYLQARTIAAGGLSSHSAPFTSTQSRKAVGVVAYLKDTSAAATVIPVFMAQYRQRWN